LLVGGIAPLVLVVTVARVSVAPVVLKLPA
jgi:hypothetical protein